MCGLADDAIRDRFTDLTEAAAKGLAGSLGGDPAWPARSDHRAGSVFAFGLARDARSFRAGHQGDESGSR